MKTKSNMELSKQAQELPLGHYKHYKGGEYDVLGVGVNSESKDELVIYQDPKTEMVWLRPLTMFTEKVEVDGKSIPRFKYQGVDVEL